MWRHRHRTRIFTDKERQLWTRITQEHRYTCSSILVSGSMIVAVHFEYL